MNTEVKTEGAKETRERLLSSAVSVFCRKGFGTTKLEDIALESGHTRGAISFHFKNKLTIYKEALLHNIKESLGRDQSVLLAGDPPLITMENMVNLMVDECEIRFRETSFLNSFYIEKPAGMETVSEQVDSMFKTIFSAHEDVLQQGIDEGVFQKDINVSFEAKSFYTWFSGYYANLKRFYDGGDCDSVKAYTREIFIKRILR